MDHKYITIKLRTSYSLVTKNLLHINFISRTAAAATCVQGPANQPFAFESNLESGIRIRIRIESFQLQRILIITISNYK